MSYILILLAFLFCIIPVGATVNWTYDGNESVAFVVDPINATGMGWAYEMAMANKSNATDFPVISFAVGVASPWQTLFTGFDGLFIIIIWGVFMVMSYRSSGSVFVPATMGAITSGAIIILLPDMFDTKWMILLLVASIASVIYTMFVQED